MNAVAKNILIKAGLIEGNKEGLMVGVLSAGGAQMGAFSAGVLEYMIDLGLYDKMDVAVGISASAPNIAHFLTKNKSAVATYWEDNINGLINLWRFWRVIDISYLENALRHSKPLDVMSIKNNPTKFYVAVTNLNGQGELINVKNSIDIIEPIIASCSIPLFWNKPKKINNKLYFDGEIGMPLPVQEVSEKFNLSDLLVIVNAKEVFSEDHSFIEKIFLYLQLKDFSKRFIREFLNQKAVGQKSFDLARAGVLPNGCRVSIIYPTYDISRVCTNVKTLKNFTEEGKKRAREFFVV